MISLIREQEQIGGRISIGEWTRKMAKKIKDYFRSRTEEEQTNRRNLKSIKTL